MDELTGRAVKSCLVTLFLVSTCFLGGCSRAEVAESEIISTCSSGDIERSIQNLYDKSLTEIKTVNRFINYAAFNKTCSGSFQARAPIEGFSTKSKYPEISIGFNVSYSINRNSGICITRASRPISAGVYSACFK